MSKVCGKATVVMGDGSGIARALVAGLARRGAHLALFDVNGQRPGETAVQARSAPGCTPYGRTSATMPPSVPTHGSR